MHYIGLDVGTSGCKASVLDANGKVVAYANHTYRLLSPEPGHVEIDAAVVWERVKATLSEAVNKAKQNGVDPSDIVALSAASFGEAVVLTDERGEPLAPSIYYSDIRGDEETRDVAEAADAGTIVSVTGMPPNPMFSANKLLWIKKHRPALLDSAKYLMLFGDFIGYKLTGERAIDYSLASRTMLFDINTNKWSVEIAGKLGLPADRFSKPVQAGTTVGRITGEVAEETGLPRTLSVVAGGHDQALAALGSGALLPGQSIDGMGSSECITTVIEKGGIDAGRMAEYNFCCEPHVVAGRFITLAFNASAGTAMTWFKNRFFSDLARDAEAAKKDFHMLADALVPGDMTDVLFLPYVGGSGTPYMNSTTGGAFIGLSLATDAPTMYKAVLEGICFEMRLNLDLLDSLGLAPHEIRAVGGNTRSEPLMQIKADIFGKEIHVLEDWEIGTVALAYLCASAGGEESGVLDNLLAHTVVGRVYKPNPETAEIYNKKMERYKKLYPQIREV